jgi:hypothetical protein
LLACLPGGEKNRRSTTQIRPLCSAGLDIFLPFFLSGRQ